MSDAILCETLFCEIEDQIATVTLNRPQVLNALSTQVFDDLKYLFTRLAEDSEVRVILLTGAGEIEDRELGKSSNLRVINDRVWVLTGNNPVLGGDMVRRTIPILIDPDMANPETRSFSIANLFEWARERRGEVLQAMLCILGHWVAEGMQRQERAQSDSYADWSASVGGILAAAGIEGRFDHHAGEKISGGGEDDEHATLLSWIWDVKGDHPFVVRDLIYRDLVTGERPCDDSLPGTVMANMARAESSGVKSLGRWLLGHKGRWVSYPDGSAMVVKESGKNGYGVMKWYIEKR